MKNTKIIFRLVNIRNGKHIQKEQTHPDEFPLMKGRSKNGYVLQFVGDKKFL